MVRGRPYGSYVWGWSTPSSPAGFPALSLAHQFLRHLLMNKHLTLPLCSVLLLAACTPSDQEQPAPAVQTPAVVATTGETEAHQHEAEAPLPAPPSSPWATDAPLRQGMDGIAKAIAAAETLKAAGTFGAADATLLDDSIQKQFQYMAANCKLEPQADAALHGLVAQLLKASSALKADPAGHANFETLRHVLMEYPHYFNHQGWQPQG